MTEVEVAADPRIAALRAATPALVAALLAKDMEAANAILAGLPGMETAFRVEITPTGRAVEAAPVWRVTAPGRSLFRFYVSTWYRFPDLIINRFVPMLPLMVAALDRVTAPGRLSLNLGDEGHVPGLAFCENRAEFTLIPDAIFMMSHGYAANAQAFAAQDIAFADRAPVLFWRGASTGLSPGDPFALPRVRLCRLASAMRDKADVGLSEFAQLDPETEVTLRAEGLLRDYVHARDFDRYRLHLDIDGNSNSWPGLFTKLQTGSPVLKVQSQDGFRQWFYDRLIPWVNYVPIRSDMADLVETTELLLASPHLAREIGERGRELARSMSYAAEIAGAAGVVADALKPLGPDAVPAA